jgi:hypothetical protein
MGSGYTRGRGSILWNGNNAGTVSISRAGTFRKDFTIPSGAPPGVYTITVCWGVPCSTGEFAQRASVNFKVIRPSSPPQLTVEPNSGYAGDVVVLEGSNYSPGRGSIFWNGNTAGTVSISRAGTLRENLTIPEEASPGDYTISVTDESKQKADTTFTVKGRPQPPQLSVNPGSGHAGTVVTLEGRNYTPGSGSILWNGKKVRPLTIPRTGTFSEVFTVPKGTSPHDYTISIIDELKHKANVDFTVTEPPPPILTDLLVTDKSFQTEKETVKPGEYFWIKATAESGTPGIVDRVNVKIYPQGEEDTQLIEVELVETGPDTLEFRSPPEGILVVNKDTK